MLKAVVFDLDDTLYREYDYVKSGFHAVADYLGEPEIFNKLIELYQINNKNVFQRMGISAHDCQKCIEIYRNHFPKISLQNDVVKTLAVLKKNNFKLGIITDGRVEGQHNKLQALGLYKLIPKVIITDTFGIEFRKPHPKSFECMREYLEVQFDEMMYVGDNPQKDFYISKIYPIYTVRVDSFEKGLYGNTQYYGNVTENLRINRIDELLDVLNIREE